MPRRFSKLRCNRQRGETARRASRQARASDWKSWKEITCYLRRSVRCVQRWEKNEGLPILRHQHARGATVYAYREKLDEWWRGGASDI